MADAELNSKLYAKMSAEQDKFRSWLMDQPPADILNHAVEYTVREDILMEMGVLELPDDQARALLASPDAITVLAREVAPSRLEEGENRLSLGGALCRRPTLRRTPLGREICDLLLAVNRPYGRADYLPCIAWGSLAAHCGALDVGDRLRLEGRLQSRQYHKIGRAHV